MSTAITDREQWLEARREQIGASEVAAILGISPWQTAWEVWADKRRMLDDWKGNKATDHGNIYESSVLDYAERQVGLLERNIRVIADGLPMAATLDARHVGTKWPIQAKTTGLIGPVYGDWGDEGTDQIPDYYLTQMHSEIICSGADAALMFALIAGRGTCEFRVERNERIVEEFGNICTDWWERHITQGIEPSRETPPRLEVVKRMKREPKKVIDLDSTAWSLCLERAELKAEAKDLKKKIDNVDSRLILELGDAEAGNLPDGRQVTYFEQPRKGYTVDDTSFRVLRVKG